MLSRQWCRDIVITYQITYLNNIPKCTKNLHYINLHHEIYRQVLEGTYRYIEKRCKRKYLKYKFPVSFLQWISWHIELTNRKFRLGPMSWNPTVWCMCYPHYHEYQNQPRYVLYLKLQNLGKDHQSQPSKNYHPPQTEHLVAWATLDGSQTELNKLHSTGMLSRLTALKCPGLHLTQNWGLRHTKVFCGIHVEYIHVHHSQTTLAIVSA